MAHDGPRSGLEISSYRYLPCVVERSTSHVSGRSRCQDESDDGYLPPPSYVQGGGRGKLDGKLLLSYDDSAMSLSYLTEHYNVYAGYHLQK